VAGFLTPESVLYDSAQDIYFVSNINGSPTAKDNNGFIISRVRPDGAVENLKFIEGGHNGVTLHAPKGMALRGDTLWLADIDAVRAFNAKTGSPGRPGGPERPGGVFLNDIAVAQNGALYINRHRHQVRRRGQRATSRARPDLSRWPRHDRNGRRPGRYARLANGITLDVAGKRIHRRAVRG